jgi:hypothetical protein
MDKLEEISAGKKEAPAAGEGATPEGSGEVAAAEAKAADTREAVAAEIDVDKPLSGSTATASEIAAPEGLPPLAPSVPPRLPQAHFQLGFVLAREPSTSTHLLKVIGQRRAGGGDGPVEGIGRVSDTCR